MAPKLRHFIDHMVTSFGDVPPLHCPCQSWPLAWAVQPSATPCCKRCHRGFLRRWSSRKGMPESVDEPASIVPHTSGSASEHKVFLLTFASALTDDYFAPAAASSITLATSSGCDSIHCMAGGQCRRGGLELLCHACFVHWSRAYDPGRHDVPGRLLCRPVPCPVAVASLPKLVPRLRHRDVIQHAATIEGIRARCPQATHAEWRPLQGRVRIFGLLQYQHREVGEAQLTGEKQTDRAGTGNHDVVDQTIPQAAWP